MATRLYPTGTLRPGHQLSAITTRTCAGPRPRSGHTGRSEQPPSAGPRPGRSRSRDRPPAWKSRSSPYVWISDPLNADVTISGSITWNIWARESSNTPTSPSTGGWRRSMARPASSRSSTRRPARPRSPSDAADSVNNFAETPAAGVACKRGDRLRVRIFGDDVDAHGDGLHVQHQLRWRRRRASGDSWLQLTENLTFVTEPAGSQVFLTDTASRGQHRERRPRGMDEPGRGRPDRRHEHRGRARPRRIQITDTAGGTVVDWFTRPLTAFTLGGAVRCNIRALESNTAANASMRVEIARVAGDGTSPPSGGGRGRRPGRSRRSRPAQSFLVAGDDLAISDGQRLRIRLCIDDAARLAMAALGQTVTLYYAGTSGGASGDTYLTFTQTLTEFVRRPADAARLRPTPNCFPTTRRNPCPPRLHRHHAEPDHRGRRHSGHHPHRSTITTPGSIIEILRAWVGQTATETADQLGIMLVRRRPPSGRTPRPRRAALHRRPASGITAARRAPRGRRAPPPRRGRGDRHADHLRRLQQPQRLALRAGARGAHRGHAPTPPSCSRSSAPRRRWQLVGGHHLHGVVVVP